jgi:hypothetical protein
MTRHETWIKRYCAADAERMGSAKLMQHRQKNPSFIAFGGCMGTAVLECAFQLPQLSVHLYSGPFVISTEHHRYYVAQNAESAGAIAEAYWTRLATADTKAFSKAVGSEILLQWARGLPAGPGKEKFTSLSSWLQAWRRRPQDHFAILDGKAIAVTYASTALQKALGFMPSVAYRIS